MDSLATAAMSSMSFFSKARSLIFVLSLSAAFFGRSVHSFDNTRFDNVWIRFDFDFCPFWLLVIHSACCVSFWWTLTISKFLILPDSYWGQNSYGATHPDDPANWQQRLSFYCGDDSVVDAFPVAFLNVFFGTGGLPSINLANVCVVSVDNFKFSANTL